MTLYEDIPIIKQLSQHYKNRILKPSYSMRTSLVISTNYIWGNYETLVAYLRVARVSPVCEDTPLIITPSYMEICR